MNINLLNETIFKLELYAVSIRKIHYTTDDLDIHEICDDTTEMLRHFIDEFAESMYGYVGKQDYSKFKKLNAIPIQENENLNNMIDSIISVVNYFHESIEYNDQLNGTKTSINKLVKGLRKQKFLLTFTTLK